MHSLQGFSDAGTPVVSDLDEATPALTEATRHLTPFTAASTVALKALGNAGEASGPTFNAADPVVKKARNLARTGASPTTKLAKFLVSTKKTKGFDYLSELIYNGTAAINQFDQYGHFIQSVVDTHELQRTTKSCHRAAAMPPSAKGRKPPPSTRRRHSPESRKTKPKKSGGTAATSSRHPMRYLKPSTIRLNRRAGLGEGERLGAGVSASPPQRALLNYLLGP